MRNRVHEVAELLRSLFRKTLGARTRGLAAMLAVAACVIVPQLRAAEPGPALYLLTDSSRLAYQQGDVLELNVVVKTPKELTLDKLSLVFHAADSEITIPAGSPGKVPAGSHTFSYRVDTRDLKPGSYSLRAELPPVGSAEKHIFIAPGTPKTHFTIALYATEPHIEKAAQWKQMSEQYRFNLYWPYIRNHLLPKPIELKDYQAGLKDALLPPHEPMAEEVGIEASPQLTPQWGYDLATRCGIDMYPGGLGQHQPLQNVDASWADPAVRELSRHYATYNAQRLRRYSSFKGLRPQDEAGLTWWPKKEGGQPLPLYPHPAQTYLYKKLYGVEPPSQGTAYKEQPEEWLRWMTFRTRLMGELYEGVRKSLKSINPSYSLHSGNYAPEQLMDGCYPPTQGYAMDVISSHAYSDPLSCWYYYDMQRMDNWEKPSWFMPVWWPDFDHSLVRALIGSTLIGGTAGVGWGIEEDFGFNTAPHGATDLYVLGEVQKLNTFLEENGEFISGLKRQASPVAILFSLTEGAFSLGGDFDTFMEAILWNQTYSGRINHAWLTSVLAGYPPDPICEEEVLKGNLVKHKILLLVRQCHLTPPVQQKLDEFTKSGGRIFLDGESTVQIAGATKLSVSFTDVYQLQRDLSDRAKKETRTNDLYYWRAAFLDPNYNEPVAKVLRSAYESVTSPPVVSSKPRVAWRVHTAGDGTYLIGLNAQESGGDFRWPFGHHSVAGEEEVGLPTKNGPVYDLEDGKALPITEKDGRRFARVPMRAGDFKILCLLPERPAKLNLKAPRTASPGTELPVRVEVAGEKAPILKVGLPLKVSITDPTGKERYGVFRAARDGVYEESFPIAVNDRPGRWTVRVSEPLEGKVVESSFELREKAAAIAAQEEAAPVSDEASIRQLLASKPSPLWIVAGDKQHEEAATSLKASLNARGILSEIKLAEEIRKEDPPPVVQIPKLAIQEWKRSQFPPAYLNIPAHLILLGDISDNSLIREIQDAGLLLRPITPELPGAGKAYVEYCWSPFEVERDAILVLASDAGGLSAGMNRLLELAAGKTAKTKSSIKAQVRFQETPGKAEAQMQPLATVDLSREPIRSLSASADGRFLAAGGYDGSVTLLNEKGEKLWSKSLPGFVHKVRVSQSGDKVVAASWPSLVAFSKEGKEIWKVTRSSADPFYSYLPDFHVLDIGSTDGAVAAGTLDDLYLLVDAGGKELWRKNNKTGQSHVWSVGISESAGRVVVGDETEVVAYDKAGNKLWAAPLTRPRCLALSADGSHIYAGGLSRVLLCLNADGKEQWKLPTPGYVMALLVDEKNGLVMAGISNGEMLGIEAATGKVAWKASSSVSDRGVARSIECMAAQKGGGLIAAGTQGGEVFVISPNGQILKRWKGQDEWITDVAFVGNGRLAASTWSGRIEFFEEAGHP